MATARSEILSDDEEIYHCVSRCVRRAFLCGFDVLTGKSFDHRKGWLKKRLEFLKNVFTIDMLAYALMSTHQHLLLRTRPDILAKLSDEEVAIRWLTLYPVTSGIAEDVSKDEACKNLVKNKARIEELRKRLGSISWYMKSVNEFIARRANKEDDCKGRFWEGRFKSQRLEDESAIFTCAMYIDLNPIRAKIAETPEESKFTSAHERINALRSNAIDKLWLSPLQDTKKEKGFLSIDLPTYLSILDETGRILVKGKRGQIPNRLAPILERIGIKSSYWTTTVRHYGKWFSVIAGRANSITPVAKSLNRKWLKGIAPARLAFS